MKADFSKIVDYISQKGKNNLFVIIGIAGILLVFLSDLSTDKKTEIPKSEISLLQYKTELEKEVVSLLKEIDGVGDVKVMITLESGEENIYVRQEKTASDTKKQKNDDNMQENSQLSFEDEIVIVEESGKNYALVEKTISPKVQGVAVVCSGAGDIKVVSAVTNSVAVVLDIPTHKICVTKMR